MKTVVPYRLDVEETGSEFYRELELFTDKILRESEIFLKTEIDNFILFVKEHQPENLKPRNEYLIEFLTLGLYYNDYEAYASGAFKPAVKFLKRIYPLRNYTFLKKATDRVRGFLITNFLYREKKFGFPYYYKDFKNLISWLEATGDFNQELKRLKTWGNYLSSIKSEDCSYVLMKATGFAFYFSEQGKSILGSYTSGVDKFLTEQLPKYRNREDYIFCGRSEAQYFLNMFGAEVLNRQLKESFETAKKKVLVLPACMCHPFSGKCKAIESGFELVCQACNPDCQINKLRIKYNRLKIQTVIVKHSSEFSKVLKRWKDDPETGVVGVGCVLNLISGGYEMMSENIKSQCVMLNYPGCSSHWPGIAKPTRLDSTQLEKIIGSPKPLSLKKEQERILAVGL